MSEPDSELERTGSLIGGLMVWVMIAAAFGIVAYIGQAWGALALAGWCLLLALDYMQSYLRNASMYVRLLSELWWIPI